MTKPQRLLFIKQRHEVWMWKKILWYEKEIKRMKAELAVMRGG